MKGAPSLARGAASAAGVTGDRDAGSRLYLAGGAAIVFLATLLKLWAIRQWSWFQDDWSYLERTVDLDFWAYVVQDYNGHFMPLQFTVIWVMTALSPLNYGWAIIVLIVVIVAGICVWWALLHAIFGRRPQVLLGAAIVAFCPLLIQSTLWWASGLQTYSLVCGTGAVLLCAFKYLDGGHYGWIIAALLTFLVALLTWEKALLIVIPCLFLVGVLPGVSRSGPDFWRRALWLAGGILGIAVAYSAAFFFATSAPVAGDTHLGAPSPEGLLGFALTAGLGILLPSILGGTWESVGSLQGAYPMAPTWMQWGLALSLCILGALAVSLRRSALWILALPLAYALMAWGLVVGSSRFESLGQFASLDSRYSADIVPILALSLVYLVTSTRQERVGVGAWLSPIPIAMSRKFHAACGVLIIGVVMSSLVTWSLQMDGLGPNSPRSWTDRLIASAGSVGPITAFDSNAPDNVVYPAFLPNDARISRMIAPLGVPIRFDLPTDRLYVVDGNGEFTPGVVAEQTRSFPGPNPGCGYLVVPGAPAVRVPMSREMYNWNWGMQVGYLAKGESSLRIVADLASQEILLSEGLGSKQSVMVSSVSTLFLSVPEGRAPVCVDYVAFGPVDPAGVK